MTLAERARTFKRLHEGPRALVLPNVWDAVSARMVETAGFPALATSSAAVAWALGHADGERVSREEMAAAVARITRVVSVPVTADMEAGYGPTPEDAAATARAAMEAGAVGMNLEDAGAAEGALVEVEREEERIRAVREAADAAGVPFVLNARTDVYLAGVGAPETRFAEAVRRLNAYRAAGADSLFCPMVEDAPTLAALVRELDGPLNVLARGAAPPVPELERLGVRRVSLGAGLMRAALGAVERVAAEAAGPGTWESLRGLMFRGDVNALFRD